MNNKGIWMIKLRPIQSVQRTLYKQFETVLLNQVLDNHENDSFLITDKMSFHSQRLYSSSIIVVKERNGEKIY
jgi:hypothetical protein